ncbi:hypothetical protein [Micromonospora sp. LOL_023]|uniref:hypothetical protein n=1 Tax=Micromonospora sp. LOL_023 TaxID=3345418 RepID=UPI003A83F6FD
MSQTAAARRVRSGVGPARRSAATTVGVQLRVVGVLVGAVGVPDAVVQVLDGR